MTREAGIDAGEDEVEGIPVCPADAHAASENGSAGDMKDRVLMKMR